MLIMRGVSAMTQCRVLGFDHRLMLDVTRIGQITTMHHLVSIMRRWLDVVHAVMMCVLVRHFGLPIWWSYCRRAVQPPAATGASRMLTQIGLLSIEMQR